jgi:lipopolysaccharide transport system ATP-binding protein
MEDNIAISIKNISKKYRLQQPIKDADGNVTHELWALKDVSFEIKKGESIGIIGSNGSGKSTLLKILAGVTKPTIGSAEIKGRLASILDIGAGFHPELSGRDNVFLNGQIYGFTKSEIKRKYNEIVAFSGIEKFIDEPVKNYSNGMYLRLAFSIMAHLDFDVYLFDEVFSVGDAEFSMKARKRLKELANDKHTVVYVSHNLLELENKDYYIHLEYGVLKDKTSSQKVLDDYIQQSVGTKIKVHTKNVEISDFSTYSNSDEVLIHSVKFHQDNIDETGFFCTNKSFILEIDYEKLRDFNTVDIVVNINDYKGTSVLSTAPFIKGDFSDVTKAGRKTAKCIFPEYLFNAQIYFLSVNFTLNLTSLVKNNKSSVFNEDYHGGNIVKIACGLQNVVIFKGVLVKSNKIMDLSDVNVKGNLLPGFEWE